MALAHLQAMYKKLETALKSQGVPTAGPFCMYLWFPSITIPEEDWATLSMPERPVVLQKLDFTTSGSFVPELQWLSLTSTIALTVTVKQTIDDLMISQKGEKTSRSTLQ